MSKERELLKECYFYIDNKIGVSPKELLIRIEKLLAPPERDTLTDKPTATAMAVMPNGTYVSNAYVLIKKDEGLYVRRSLPNLIKILQHYNKG